MHTIVLGLKAIEPAPALHYEAPQVTVTVTVVSVVEWQDIGYENFVVDPATWLGLPGMDWEDGAPGFKFD